jgi:hypothetical protein
VILVATEVASVLLEVVAAVAPLMMLVPFTVTAVTAVLPLPENVMVADCEPASVTTGVNPLAPAGPVIVTTLPDAVALKPFSEITEATFVATVLGLVEGTEGPLTS